MKNNIVAFVNEAINRQYIEINDRLRKAILNPRDKKKEYEHTLAQCGIQKRYDRDNDTYIYTGQNGAKLFVTQSTNNDYRWLQGMQPADHNYNFNLRVDDPEFKKLDFYSFFMKADITARKLRRKSGIEHLPSNDLIGNRRPSLSVEKGDMLYDQQKELQYFRKTNRASAWDQRLRSRWLKDVKDRTGYYAVVDPDGKRRIVKEKGGQENEK